MQRAFLLLLAAVLPMVLSGCGGSASSVKLEASGASFPSALYQDWFKKYRESHPNVKPDYQSVGSGKGVTDFLEGRSDFGASDAAMNEEEIAAADKNRGVILLPMTAGAIVVAYHADLPADLKLTREVYSKIFLGEIKNWNDSAIAASNPGVTLPDQGITVVHRSDKSGTTYVFTRHLDAISPEFHEKLGYGKEVAWPNTGFVAGAKNDGVAAAIKQTPGAIGYIEYGFSVTADLPVASLENKAGKFVAPSLETSSKALENVELPPDMIAWASDPAGDESYPLVTYTWMMVHKSYDKEKGEALKELLLWCLDEGQTMSEGLHFVKLPANVVEKVKAKVEEIKIASEKT
ncbi:phosphate ABC transporter substrate-binding protein PstS [Lignipirellula cremea]|uniref:Phosphate-binding protein n=1 Tax=Lignipirellula cremea TaxID=2528010 RepID=A0A518DPY1_9BACT|nr:phosphate ABC transporter substrate-binding protein PstS [Lignipirellula cremea]QDU93900.1 Phosphate-binding protein PstS precursor [Lignipirellula cremea]